MAEELTPEDMQMIEEALSYFCAEYPFVGPLKFMRQPYVELRDKVCRNNEVVGCGS